MKRIPGLHRQPWKSTLTPLVALILAALPVIMAAASVLIASDDTTDPAAPLKMAEVDEGAPQGGSNVPDDVRPPSLPVPVQPPRVVDIFSVQRWESRPPAPTQTQTAPPSRPTPPPAPQAPPLPFRYIGKITEPGKADAFLLAQGERVLSISIGDSINGTYIVDKYENGQLGFLYRPLKIRQTLYVGVSP